jgi:hypothetical protein
MSKKTVFAFLALISLLFLMVPLPAHSAVSRTTVFIQPNGDVNPSNVPIQRSGDTYTFTGNMYDPIFVQKSNIVIDGAGYSLIGPLNETEKTAEPPLGLGPNTTFSAPYIIGIDFDKSVYGVTVKNVNVTSFNIDMYIRTTNNTIINNAAWNSNVGILLSGSGNKIVENYIADNMQGLFFGFEQVNGSAANLPSNIDISQNSFVNNTMQLSGCVCKVYNFSEARHAWDNGKQGNYWSDYNGTDANHDGIGDTYYVVDVLNYDRFPLIQSLAQPPAPTPKGFPVEDVVLGAAVGLVVAAAVVFAYKRSKRK